MLSSASGPTESGPFGWWTWRLAIRGNWSPGACVSITESIHRINFVRPQVQETATAVRILFQASRITHDVKCRNGATHDWNGWNSCGPPSIDAASRGSSSGNPPEAAKTAYHGNLHNGRIRFPIIRKCKLRLRALSAHFRVQRRRCSTHFQIGTRLRCPSSTSTRVVLQRT